MEEPNIKEFSNKVMELAHEYGLETFDAITRSLVFVFNPIKKKGAIMSKKLKKIPAFKNEDEEADFWNTHDSTEYIDWFKAKRARFPNLKPSSMPISIRIPTYMISELKVKANRLDIPYQTLIKQAIAKELMAGK